MKQEVSPKVVALIVGLVILVAGVVGYFATGGRLPGNEENLKAKDLGIGQPAVPGGGTEYDPDAAGAPRAAPK